MNMINCQHFIRSVFVMSQVLFFFEFVPPYFAFTSCIPAWLRGAWSAGFCQIWWSENHGFPLNLPLRQHGQKFWVPQLFRTVGPWAVANERNSLEQDLHLSKFMGHSSSQEGMGVQSYTQSGAPETVAKLMHIPWLTKTYAGFNW